MGSLLMPQRRLAVAEPHVIEMPGSPDIYANGWIVRIAPEIVEMIFYVERMIGDAIECERVARVPICRSGFGRSFEQAIQRWAAEAGH